MIDRDDCDELVKLADAYEAGTAKCVASGYEEFGPAFQRERALVATALRRLASSDGGVKVRELEWEKGEGNLSGQIVWSSGDPWVFWIVKDADKPSYVWCENFNIEGWCPASPVRGVFDTLEAAKAAAQQDYEARIRSALVEVPSVKGGPEPVAWIVKLKYSADHWSGEMFTDILPLDKSTYRVVRPLYTAHPADAGMREAVQQALDEAAHIASLHTHHALWHGLLPYGWDAATEQFGRNLAGAIAKAIKVELPKRLSVLTAPGATTKSDGGGESRPANPGTGGRAPCIEQTTPATMPAQAGVAPGPSDPSPTRSDVTALTDIAKERQRQREVKGWSLAHDDAHVSGELAMAGACYALASSLNTEHALNTTFTRYWPWGRKWWKPKTPRENLVRAGALIVAEIERIDRLETHEIRRK